MLRQKSIFFLQEVINKMKTKNTKATFVMLSQYYQFYKNKVRNYFVFKLHKHN